MNIEEDGEEMQGGTASLAAAKEIRAESAMWSSEVA